MTTKFYPNPQRKQAMAKDAQYKPYVPQYQLRGLEPEDFASVMEKKKFNTKHNAILIKGSPDMSNAKPTWRGQDISQNVPFADVSVPTDHLDMPNVGNNIENTWASIDSDIIDDIGMSGEWSGTQQMIDNNDYIDIEQVAQPSISLPDPQIEAELSSTSPDVKLEEDEYLVAIDGTVITTGSLSEIEEEVKQLIFGDHALYSGKQIPVEDIIVLKRLNIKVGVFING